MCLTGHEVADELDDVGPDAAALFDGLGDGVELVVGDDDVGGLLRHVGAVLAHGDAHVRALAVSEAVWWRGSGW